MRVKVKLKIFNICIIVLSILVVVLSIFSVYLNFIGTEKTQTLEVKAEGEVQVLKKTGLLDIMGETIDFTPQALITINNTQDFVGAFNSYFERLRDDGGYSLKSNLVITGTAKKFNITAYQATSYCYEIDENGNMFSENITAEIASPNGTTTGYGEFSGKKIWNDGKTLKSQTTFNVNCVKDGDKYNLSGNYENCNPSEETVSQKPQLLPFVVNEQTISQFSIEESALTYTVKISLNEMGFKTIADDAKQQAKATQNPNYSKFELTIVLDKWGNVTSLQRSECFTLVVSRFGINVESETQSICSYIINKIKKEN